MEAPHTKVARLLEEARLIVGDWTSHSVAGEDAQIVHDYISSALASLSDVYFEEARELAA